MSDTPEDGDRLSPPSSRDIKDVDYPNEKLRPHREKLRGVIAIWLLAIFTAEVLARLACQLFFENKSAAAKDIVGLILTPTIALLGAVSGFYYGAKDT